MVNSFLGSSFIRRTRGLRQFQVWYSLWTKGTDDWRWNAWKWWEITYIRKVKQFLRSILAIFIKSYVQLVELSMKLCCVSNISVSETGSEEYENFLALLGDKISLKGWDRYRGGLDVKGWCCISCSSQLRVTAFGTVGTILGSIRVKSTTLFENVF